MTVFTEENPAMTVEGFTSEIEGLEGSNLRSVAAAFNRQRFIDSLLEDGFSIDDVHEIFVAFAQRFVQTGQRPPETGAVNLLRLAREEGFLGV